MRSRCFRQVVISSVAAVAWVAVVGLMWAPPDPTDALRLPFFTVLGLAIGATSLAVFPWMMADYIRDATLSYIAGYMHRETDEAAKGRPALELVK